MQGDRQGREKGAHEDQKEPLRAPERESNSCPTIRPNLSGAAEERERQDSGFPILLLTTQEHRPHPPDLRPSQAVDPDPEQIGGATQATVQLSSYLCDNMHNVWNESLFYRPTARTLRSDAALNICALA